MNAEQMTTPSVVSIRRIADSTAALEHFHPNWESAEPVAITRYWSGEIAPESRHLIARLLWSDLALHVRFDCRQEEPLIVSDAPQIEEKTLGLWDRDVCEIFISPPPLWPERYFEFEAAPTGEWIDLAIRKTDDSRETDWQFQSGMKALARMGDESVSIAMTIPWKGLGYKPEIESRWRGNLTRCIGDDPTRGYLAWRPTYAPRPDFHVPEVFGELVFTS